MTDFAEVARRGLQVNGMGEVSPGCWSVCLTDSANPPQLQQGQGANPAEAMAAALAAVPFQGATTFTVRIPGGSRTYTSETAHLIRKYTEEEELQTRLQAISQVNPKLGAQLSLARLGL